MARRHVSYEEAARPGGVGHRAEVDLDRPSRREPPDDRSRAGGGRGGAWLAVAAAVVALLAWAAWPAPSTAPPPGDPTPTVRTRLGDGGPVPVRARDVLPAPWRGVFEHHPRPAGAETAARVHAVSLADADGTRRALLVVDATRRAFSGPERGWRSDGSPERVLGDRGGTELRTLQWDDGGYGLSLTSVGLTLPEQERLADAVRVPEGESLSHGRAPVVEVPALVELRLAEVDRRSGPGATVGSHLLGHTGGASIDGLVHRADGGTVLVSAVEDQLVGAEVVRRALGRSVEVPAPDGVTAAALVAHGGVPELDGRIRGWVRLVLDHRSGVTVEVASDALDAGSLVALASQLDLGQLARTVAPAG